MNSSKHFEFDLKFLDAIIITDYKKTLNHILNAVKIYTPDV